MIEKILKNYEHVSIENKEDVYDLLSFNLKNIFRDIDFGGISFTKKFVNVLGPTGVGKTTTLAKLAAKCVLDEEKKVAFITTDTYRIAAIEQLKTYAQILSVPLEVCYNAQDFIAAKNKFSDYDVVFIDASKGKYPFFLKEALRLLAPKGIIFADNVLYKGYVLSDYNKHKQRTAVRNLREYIKEVSENPNLETEILEVGDGLAVSKVK